MDFGLSFGLVDKQRKVDASIQPVLGLVQEVSRFLDLISRGRLCVTPAPDALFSTRNAVILLRLAHEAAVKNIAESDLDGITE